MKYSKNVFRSLTMITQFGINMIVPIVMCSFIGWWMDQKMETSYCFVIMFFVGAIAGGRNVWVFARKIFTQTDTKRRRPNKVESIDDREA